MMEKLVERIKNNARKLLLAAKRESGLEAQITLMIQRECKVDGAARAEIIWSSARRLRAAKLWIPGEPGFVRVNAAEDGEE